VPTKEVVITAWSQSWRMDRVILTFGINKMWWSVSHLWN